MSLLKSTGQLAHLSKAKRGYKTKSCLIGLINSILYKYKNGICIRSLLTVCYMLLY